jgi:hypothetical protein
MSQAALPALQYTSSTKLPKHQCNALPQSSTAAGILLLCILLLLLQGKLCWVLQCLAYLLGLGGVSQRLANAPTLQVGNALHQCSCLGYGPSTVCLNMCA